MAEEGRVIIDGSFGEGGGQILRTAVALSVVSGKPTQVVNIRAGRSIPGLRPQHLSAIRTLAELFSAHTEGLHLGSRSIYFSPRKQARTTLDLDIGTAGSITLLLQAVIPSVSLTGGEASVQLSGGTDVRGGPTMDYMRHVMFTAYQRLGINVEVEVVRRGYYPKGGGIVKALVRPRRETPPFQAVGRAPVPTVSILSVCGKLPRSVAERQATECEGYLSSRQLQLASVEARVEDAISPGTSIVAFAGGETSLIGGDSIGERGKPAEVVGREAAERFFEEHRSGAPIDSHLADMIVPILACTPGESRFHTSKITGHLRTNLHVASLFTSCQYETRDSPEGGIEIAIHGQRPS